ncbi:MSC_0619 family F1-like ATPase alpha subunit [Metamycoplasma auris]|uniref:F-type H+-transporting ATPase subunit alpha n=1 Tax=Metamycoplasma auris TaxID=51363 RepID=A0A2W7G6N8_9BACT|nr:ATP F0F1 synthase subunit alpha [Metamycoplasma auris]PZW01594.1 F-type H+-transporting ATPase subunit alpha [Metamycoplasma auris]
MKNICSLEEYSKPKVTSIFNYIIEVQGKFNYEQSQLFVCERDKSIKMILINASEDKAYLLANNENKEIKIDDVIIPIESSDVFTSKEHFGSVIDVFGNIVLPTKKEIQKQDSDPQGPAFKLAHQLMSVKTLDKQLYTGFTLIDLLIPIGMGQRELIIGDRQTGKTHIAINVILNQAKSNTKCIYVAIGQKKESISKIYNILKENDALKNTIIIDAPATSSYEQYLAPYVGMAHAENIAKEDDVIIIFDDLTKHANIIREIALLTDKPVGKEAMPGDIFFAHSQLLERAGSFKDKKTITALPILQTVDGDITSLIASNVISITDGQIVTSADLFSQGILPAININLSVSRTGSSVQNRIMSRVASEVGKTYRQYKRHLKLAALDYELNKETAELLYKGKMIDKMFIQKGYSLYSTKFVFLMSKLISWSILRGIKEEEKALRFINLLIETNADAKATYDLIQSTTDYDDKLIRDYFAYSLKQYSNYIGLDWKVEYEHEFVEFENSYLDEIARKLGDK